ncbi:hypothetical protein GCM10010344_53250 [Streptomyces bluensis]|nr:hypothetical protein GCM10010344_53250 [Streptomyces bluensis]
MCDEVWVSTYGEPLLRSRTRLGVRARTRRAARCCQLRRRTMADNSEAGNGGSPGPQGWVLPHSAERDGKLGGVVPVIA